ncbi:hypothetical protein [Reticulibacter mediterranei]|uniref:hypothetical protein n=1 Tax=Reticulibacter mediterranei TaxID=2778369 RepID=UPI001C687A36|nr:hypothetical protein [Reticulibacter mediterranei]
MIIIKEEGCSGWLLIADHVLSTRQQPSCATSHLLQTRSEKVAVLMMRTVEMAF